MRKILRWSIFFLLFVVGFTAIDNLETDLKVQQAARVHIQKELGKASAGSLAADSDGFFFEVRAKKVEEEQVLILFGNSRETKWYSVEEAGQKFVLVLRPNDADYEEGVQIFLEQERQRALKRALFIFSRPSQSSLKTSRFLTVFLHGETPVSPTLFPLLVSAPWV